MAILLRKPAPVDKPQFPIKPSRQSAVSAVLNRHYPRVYQMALALCGDGESARRVAERVLKQSVPNLSKWTSDVDAGRWFGHFTVLCSREICGSDAPAWGTGLASAVRTLPVQQREAFLLHHGLGMELRELATAMDCSSAAATNHLLAAVNKMRAVSNGELADFTAALPAELAARVPPPQEIFLQVARMARVSRRRATLKWLSGWPTFFALWAGVIYLFFRFLY